MTADKEIVSLLKDIKKQNNTIIKILRNIDNGVNKEFFGNDSDSKNS